MVDENIVDRADRLNKELKETEAKIADHRKAIEEATARNMLAGKSNAGAVAEKPKEETPKEYAARIVRGG